MKIDFDLKFLTILLSSAEPKIPKFGIFMTIKKRFLTFIILIFGIIHVIFKV